MKLGEALNQRASLIQRLGEIRNRLNQTATVVEGDEPGETIEELLVEHDAILDELTGLIQNINRRNFATIVEGKQTVMEALAEREKLARKLKTFDGLLAASELKQNYRWGTSDVKYVRRVDVVGLRNQRKDVAKEMRQLDAKIQEINWTVDL